MTDRNVMNRFGICERCGAFVEPGAQFCDNCLKAVREAEDERRRSAESFAVCERCGTLVKPGERYCDVCRRVVALESAKEARKEASPSPEPASGSNAAPRTHPRQNPAARPAPLLGAEDDPAVDPRAGHAASREPMYLGAEDEPNPGSRSEYDPSSISSRYENIGKSQDPLTQKYGRFVSILLYGLGIFFFGAGSRDWRRSDYSSPRSSALGCLVTIALAIAVLAAVYYYDRNIIHFERELLR